MQPRWRCVPTCPSEISWLGPGQSCLSTCFKAATERCSVYLHDLDDQGSSAVLQLAHLAYDGTFIFLQAFPTESSPRSCATISCSLFLRVTSRLLNSAAAFVSLGRYLFPRVIMRFTFGDRPAPRALTWWQLHPQSFVELGFPIPSRLNMHGAWSGTTVL
jgi:hypothetical protein